MGWNLRHNNVGCRIPNLPQAILSCLKQVFTYSIIVKRQPKYQNFVYLEEIQSFFSSNFYGFVFEFIELRASDSMSEDFLI